MKRIICLMLGCFLCSVFTGCGNQAQIAELKPFQSREITTTLAETPNLYQYNNNGLSCYIPNTWEEHVAENGVKYYYPNPNKESSFFMVGYESLDGSVLSDSTFETIMNGVKQSFERFQLMQSDSHITESGIEHAWVVFHGSQSDSCGQYQCALFDSIDGYTFLVMFTEKDSTYDYSTEFTEILNSVELTDEQNQDAAQSKGNEVQDYTLTAGTYIVGQDIESGEYDVTWMDGRGTCFAGTMKETFGDSQYTTKEYRQLQLHENDAIVIRGTLVVNFYKQEPQDMRNN